MKFRLQQSGKERSDCTAPYDAVILEDGTVKDFIDEVLTNYSGEWGYIGIQQSGGTVFGDPKMEYSHGKPINREALSEYENKRIIAIRADGGWSNMNYLIQTE